MTQPEALRLANLLDKDAAAHHGDAAAELRRLHEENTLLASVNKKLITEFEELVVERRELIEALKHHQEQTRPIQKTIDALDKAQGEKE